MSRFGGPESAWGRLRVGFDSGSSYLGWDRRLFGAKLLVSPGRPTVAASGYLIREAVELAGAMTESRSGKPVDELVFPAPAIIIRKKSAGGVEGSRGRRMALSAKAFRRRSTLTKKRHGPEE